MIPTDDDWKEGINSPARAVSIYMAIGHGIDPTAFSDITAIGFSGLPMSSGEQLTDAKYIMTPGLATFEGDGIPTSAQARMRTGPLTPAKGAIEAGVWSDTISDADGAISWTLSITLSKPHTSALTIYAQDVIITEGMVTRKKDGAVVATDAIDGTSLTMGFEDVVEFDELVLQVSKLAQPFRHVRIIEIEFGSSRTLSREQLTGKAVLVEESDRTHTTVPLHQLSFSVINEGWVYDYDSPQAQAAFLAVGRPVVLSYSVQSSNGTRSIMCGRYFIRLMNTSDGTVSITADDPRVQLTDVSKAWSIPTTKSIGDALDEVLLEIGLSHSVDMSLYSVYPPREWSWDASTTYLDDLQEVCQFLWLDMVPGADGVLRVVPMPTPEAYGSVSKDRMLSYPQIKTESRKYNFVSVGYGDSADEVSRDLRQDKLNEAVNQLRIRNSLVMTEAEATALLDHIVPTLEGDQLETSWAGDPSLQAGDMAGFPGRYEDAVSRYVTYNEITYDAGLRMVTRCLM